MCGNLNASWLQCATAAVLPLAAGSEIKSTITMETADIQLTLAFHHEQLHSGLALKKV